jgi:hypothetical protein
VSFFGSLTALLKSDNRQWSKGMDQAGRDVDRLDKKTKNFFKELKGSFGKSSVLGQSVKLLAGGGAIGALSLATKDATEFVDKIAEIKKQFDAGDTSFKDMAADIAREIPVVGGFVKFFDSVRNAITGEKDEIDAMNKAVADQNAAFEERNRLIKEGAAAQREFGDLITKLKRDRELNALPEGAEKDRVRLRNERDDQLKQASENYQKEGTPDDLKKRQDEYDKLTAQLNGAQSRVNSANAAMERRRSIDANLHNKVGGDYILKLRGDDGEAAEKKRADAALAQIMTDRQNANIKLQQLQNNELDARRNFNAAKEQIDAGYAEGNKKIADQANSQDEEKHQAQMKAYEEFTGKNREALARAGDKLRHETMTPMQHFLEEMKQLDVLFQTRNIDQGTFQGMAEKLFQQLSKETELPKIEYRQADSSAIRGGGHMILEPPKISGPNPIEDLRKTAVEQLKAQRESNRLSQQQIDLIQAGDITVTIAG